MESESLYPETLFVRAEGNYGEAARSKEVVCVFAAYRELDDLKDLDSEVIAVYRFEELRKVSSSITLEDLA